jgi:hypothetical protein
MFVSSLFFSRLDYLPAAWYTFEPPLAGVSHRPAAVFAPVSKPDHSRFSAARG